MENEDFKNMFNAPEFTVDTQKYIDKYKKLIIDMDKYMEDLQKQIDEAEIETSFFLMSKMIYLEYIKENVQQSINCLNFNNH